MRHFLLLSYLLLPAISLLLFSCSDDSRSEVGAEKDVRKGEQKEKGASEHRSSPEVKAIIDEARMEVDSFISSEQSSEKSGVNIQDWRQRVKGGGVDTLFKRPSSDTTVRLIGKWGYEVSFLRTSLYEGSFGEQEGRSFFGMIEGSLDGSGPGSYGHYLLFFQEEEALSIENVKSMDIREVLDVKFPRFDSTGLRSVLVHYLPKGTKRSGHMKLLRWVDDSVHSVAEGTTYFLDGHKTVGKPSFDYLDTKMEEKMNDIYVDLHKFLFRDEDEDGINELIEASKEVIIDRDSVEDLSYRTLRQALWDPDQPIRRTLEEERILKRWEPQEKAYLPVD